MTTKPDVSAVIERGARRIACLALTNQGHQLAHLVVDERPDLADATDDDLIALCRDYATWMGDRMDECSHLVDDFVTYVSTRLGFQPTRTCGSSSQPQHSSGATH